MKSVKGFTLIELMIVVVIVAILAAVAIPSYQNSIQKTRRADAKEALTRIAAMQERYFFNNNRYGSLTELGFPTALVESQEGYYDITQPVLAAAGATPSFTLQAQSKGPQLNDGTCKEFRLDHVGRRSAKSSTNVDTTDECW